MEFSPCPSSVGRVSLLLLLALCHRRIEGVGMVSGYLVGFYDTVHAMGEQAILDDLSQFAVTRGVAL